MCICICSVYLTSVLRIFAAQKKPGLVSKPGGPRTTLPPQRGKWAATFFSFAVRPSWPMTCWYVWKNLKMRKQLYENPFVCWLIWKRKMTIFCENYSPETWVWFDNPENPQVYQSSSTWTFASIAASPLPVCSKPVTLLLQFHWESILQWSFPVLTFMYIALNASYVTMCMLAGEVNIVRHRIYSIP